jgi:Rrf2 family protein
MNSEFTVAVHSLVYLAYLPERASTSDKIAENVQTHAARIRKVMCVLRNGGYVATREGAGGGYHLLIDPATVTLGDVYDLLSQGSLVPTWCSGSKDSPCVVGSNMADVMNGIFCQAEQKLQDYLHSITLADVLAQVEACGCEESAEAL